MPLLPIEYYTKVAKIISTDCPIIFFAFADSIIVGHVNQINTVVNSTVDNVETNPFTNGMPISGFSR